MTAPWAPGSSSSTWSDASYPRAAFVDDHRLVVAEGARRTFASPPATDAATALAELPADAVVVGAARFAPAGREGPRDDDANAGDDDQGDDIDAAWAPFGGALWVEPARLSVLPWPASGATTRVAPDAQDVVDVVDRDGPRFRAAVAAALAAIAAGDVDKVVLARRFFVPLPSAFARVPSLWTSLLAHAAHGGGAPYLLAPRAGVALLGTSPERLVVVDDTQVTTDAVAGTRPATRAAELWSSDKDAREHALVVEHLQRALHTVMGAATVEPRGLRTVGAVAHRHAVVRAPRTASSRGDTPVSSLVRALHPTPAVAGWPIAKACATLATLEGFDRGLYGGVVGVVGPRRTALSVALRGALVTHEGLLITVGAGVVPGSTVDGEDAETRLKLDAVLSSLGLRRGAA